MTRRSEPIPNLIGGVSQQAASLRAGSQVSEAVNAWLSTVDGAEKRPHTNHVSKLFTGVGDGGTKGPLNGHFIDRDRNERYSVAIRNQQVKVHDIYGVEYPVKGPSGNFLKKPTVPDPTGSYWSEGGTDGVTATSGQTDPLGGTEAYKISPSSPPGSDADDNFLIQTLTESTHRLEPGRTYCFWFWAKPTPGAATTRSKIAISGNVNPYDGLTEFEINWSTPAPFKPEVVRTGLEPNLGGVASGLERKSVHDYGVIPRNDGWYILWVTHYLDPDDDTIRVALYPNMVSVSSVLGLNVWRFQVEEYNGVGPSERWMDWDPDLSDPFAADFSQYLDFHTSNDVVDPEDFSAAGWTEDANAAAGAVGILDAPLSGLGFAQSKYSTLTTLAGATAGGGYYQDVGTIYDGPQLFGCFFRKEGASGDAVRLSLKDQTLSYEAIVQYDWVGTALVATDVSAAGNKPLAYGAIQSPWDDEDWFAWLVVDPASSQHVVGSTRRLTVFSWDWEPSLTRTANAWGAIVINGLKQPRDGFLTYLESITRARAVTVADYTFIANPNIAVQTRFEKEEFSPTETRAYIWVQRGGLDAAFKVTLTRTDSGAGEDTADVSAYALTWDGQNQRARCYGGSATGAPASPACENSGGVWFPLASNPELETQDTQVIAAKLAADLNADGSIIATSTGSLIEITMASNTIVDIQVEDTFGDDALKVIWKDVENVNQLPVTMRDGWRVRIVGEGDESTDPHWVTFRTDNYGAIADGQWTEGLAWGAEVYIDETTMPHQLIRRVDQTGLVTGTVDAIYFEFGFIPMDGRRVGDDKTNPFPSFVSTPALDKKVQDIFFFQNRLGLLSDESVSLSETNLYFNWWRTTIIQVEASDPILTTASHREVSLLNHGVPIDERLILFSDRTQFVVSGDPIVSPSTIQILPKLSYENFRKARPVQSGRGLFMAYPQRAESDDNFEFSGVRELIPQRENENDLDAPDISAPIPSYIQGEIITMASRPKNGLLMVLTDLGVVYPYKYLVTDGQSVQESWSIWDFGARVLDVGIIQNDAIFLLAREDGIYLEIARVGDDLQDPGLSFTVDLDRRVDQQRLSSSYNAVDDETTFTLPYPIRTGATMAVVKKSDGNDLTYVGQGANTVIVRGDHTATEVWAGELYTMEIELTEPVLRTGDQQSRFKDISGLVTVTACELVYADSAHFDVEVSLRNGGTFLDRFSSQQLGSASLLSLEEVTNLLSDPDALDLWTKDGPILVTPNLAVAPDGSMTADFVQDIDPSGAPSIYKDVPTGLLVNAQNYVFSMSLKYVTAALSQLSFSHYGGTVDKQSVISIDWTTDPPTLTTAHVGSGNQAVFVNRDKQGFWRLGLRLQFDNSGGALALRCAMSPDLNGLGAVYGWRGHLGLTSNLPQHLEETAPLLSGTHRVSVGARQEDTVVRIRNDSYLPCKLLSGQWLMNYKQRLIR